CARARTPEAGARKHCRSRRHPPGKRLRNRSPDANPPPRLSVRVTALKRSGHLAAICLCSLLICALLGAVPLRVIGLESLVPSHISGLNDQIAALQTATKPGVIRSSAPHDSAGAPATGAAALLPSRDGWEQFQARDN